MAQFSTFCNLLLRLDSKDELDIVLNEDGWRPTSTGSGAHQRRKYIKCHHILGHEQVYSYAPNEISYGSFSFSLYSV